MQRKICSVENDRIDQLIDLGLEFRPSAFSYAYVYEDKERKKYINVDRVDIITYDNEKRKHFIDKAKEYMK